MQKKDPRLVQAEEDFEKIKKLLSNEPKIRKTKRLERLLEYVKKYTLYAYGALQDCCAFYNLKKNRYPDIEIIKMIETKLREAGRLIPKAKTLFG